MKRYLWAVIPSFLSVAIIGVAMFYLILPRTEESLINGKKAMIQELTQVAWGILESYQRQQQSGQMSLKEAQERAKSRIRQIRYGATGKDYFWIINTSYVTQVHPYRPDHEGNSQARLADSRGRFFLKEAVDLALERGGGFVSYHWQMNDNPARVEEKLSYVRLFAPWGWVVGTGVHTDDVAAEIAVMTRWFFAVGLAVLAAVALLGVFVGWRELRVAAEKARAEAALRESEETFRALAENSLDTIMRFDRQHRHVYINPVAEKQTNIPWREFIGKNPREVGFPVDLAQLIDDAIEKVFESGQPARLELELPTGLWIDLQLVPEFGEDGGVKAVSGSARDITQIKLAQAERREMEDALRRKQKLEAIGALAGGIAHDFNNILGAITGYAETALLACDQGKLPREQLLNALQACERARDLTRQVLSFSRGPEETGRPVSVRRVAEEVLRLLRASLPAGIDIVARLYSDAKVFSEAGRLHQVLLNLCTNAGQAMEPGGGRLELTVEEADGDLGRRAESGPGGQRWLRIKVTDTGGGIDPAIKDRIFEPFFTTKSQGEGTGLGLAVVHDIVSGLGGSLDFDSRPGRGTTFRVLLPVVEAEAAEEAGEEKAEAPRGSERVLFVDDEAALVEIGREVLSFLGYKVDTTTSGLDALDMFNRDPQAYDLVITDQTMPQLTGAALAAKMHEVRPDLPVILCTGKASRSVGQGQSANPELEAVLAKPVTLMEMARAVRQVLDRRKAAAAEVI